LATIPEIKPAMSELEKTAVPSKCSRCDKPMAEISVCDYCHWLNPAAAGADYFALLGLPRQFDLDEEVLRGKFRSVSRYTHPDFHATDNPQAQEMALRVSAAINDAYRTLRDPASRAAYLLELLGGKSSAEDKSIPDGFLATMMMMQEEIADARTTGDQAELDRLRGVLVTQHDGLMRRIAGLFGEYQEAVACQAIGTDLLNEIRKQLNAVSYVKKLLSQTTAQPTAG
jgi:molecular chaperone HscB